MMVMIVVTEGFSIYMLLCIYSLYKMFEMESNQGKQKELTSIKTVPNQPLLQDQQGSDEAPSYQDPPSYQEVTKLAEANQLPSPE